MPQWASTLLAVFAGGLLTYFTQRLLEDRRAERERERDAEVAAADLRVAMRLLLDDLAAIVSHYKMVADVGKYPRPQDPGESDRLFPTGAWEANKHALAAGLSDDQWGELAPAMGAAAGARLVIRRGAPLEQIPAPILAQMQHGAELARGLYISLAGEPPPSDDY